MDGGRVLDVGCGHGRFTRLLAESFGTVRSIVGIDPGKDSIDEARRSTDDRRITYRRMEIMELAPEPPRFDTVAIAYALHHVPDPAAVLSRLTDLIVPGGHLIVNEAFSDNLTPAQANGRDLHHFKAAIDRLAGIEHRETYRAEEIRALVKAADVEIVAECSEAPENGPRDEEIRWATGFIDDYLPFIRERPQHEAMEQTGRALKARIAAGGIESPSHLFIVARRRGGN
jgi:ubiquinone/menaquinone biosynthesis C-methylase UbiE